MTPARRSRRRHQDDEGPPDPARWLDRLDAWLERKLPPPRGAAATLAVFAVRLVIGRGSWVVGALLVAMSAPFFVFPYRQIESMTLALWYRATATATAEARVERAGVRLLPVPEEGGLRGEPYVILAFEPAAGRTVRVVYFFHGAGLEPFHQPYLDAGLFHSYREPSKGWRVRWVDGATGEPAIEVRARGEDLAQLATVSSWNERTYLDNALSDLDRPLDWLLAEWPRRPDDDLRLRVRHPPGNPHRLFVGDVLSRLPPTGGRGFTELFFSLLLALPFGVPFWWIGTRLLGAPLPRNLRHFLVWGPLALLPFWGTRYLEVVERLSPGASFNALARKIGSTQVLPGSIPVEALEGPRQVLDLETSRFAPLLARVDLTRPERPLSPDDAWRDLVERFTAATAELPDAELERVLVHESGGFDFQARDAVAPVLVETARRATLDGLEGFPDPELSAAAAARFAEEREWIEARKRDWGKVCP